MPGSRQTLNTQSHQPPDALTVRRFEALVLPHTDSAYNLALRLTRQSEAAEDVVHDAFLRALTGFALWRGGDVRAWLLTIVRHRAYDWLAERKRNFTLPLATADGEDADDDIDFDIADPGQETPERILIHKGEAAALIALLDALPPRLREVLVLREIEDLTYRQIAEVTDAPIGSVMSRLARARARLGEASRRLNGGLDR